MPAMMAGVGIDMHTPRADGRNRSVRIVDDRRDIAVRMNDIGVAVRLVENISCAAWPLYDPRRPIAVFLAGAFA